jgi:23S rRNA U2552 (ribose-2'-O)-methylase RlmE/FtsJ
MKSYFLSNAQSVPFELHTRVDNSLAHPLPPSPMFGYDAEVNKLRDIIDTIPLETWKRVRWYINPYDYIVEDPLINRAFYKFWEILNTWDLFNPGQAKNVLCLAEAPGGFIQGVQHYAHEYFRNLERQTVASDGFITMNKKGKQPKIVTMSLNKAHPKYSAMNLPTYNSKIITRNVSLEYGLDNSGDITNMVNYEFLKTKYNDLEFDLITADGGFDEGNDFNHKEQLHYKLFLTEVFYAMTFQSLNGNFVLKMFDLYTKPSLDILWLLLNVYREVHICKPKTSRPTNSEKYIICKGFLLEQGSPLREDIKNKLRVAIESLSLSTNKYSVFSIFDAVSPNFVNQMRFINQDICYFQCYHLKHAIQLSFDATFVPYFEYNKSFLLEQRRSLYNEWKTRYRLQTSRTNNVNANNSM